MNPLPHVDVPRLVTLASDSAVTSSRWASRASCASELPSGFDTYFPEDDDLPSVGALALCLSCPEATECLATALVHESQTGERFGWWGGLGPQEREEVAQELGIEATPAKGEELAEQPGIEAQLDVLAPADLARRLRAQNLTVSAIAAMLRCAERTVYRYLANPAA